MFSLLLCVYLGVGHRVILCLTYWVTAKLFSSSNLWGSQLLYLLANHCFLGFKKYYSHPTGCPWHLTVSSICISLKNWEYQTTWPASWEICIQVKKQHLEPDMQQQTGSKLGKEYIKAIYCYPAYLTYMQSISWEMLDWMKRKLKSRLSGEISITSDMQMTPPLRQKVKRN